MCFNQIVLNYLYFELRKVIYMCRHMLVNYFGIRTSAIYRDSSIVIKKATVCKLFTSRAQQVG